MKFANLLLRAAALVSVARASAIPADDDAQDVPTPTLTGTYDNGVIHWVITAQVPSPTKVQIVETGAPTGFTWKYTGSSMTLNGVVADPSMYTLYVDTSVTVVSDEVSDEEMIFNLPDAVVSEGDDGPWTDGFYVDYFYADDSKNYVAPVAVYTVHKPAVSKSSQSASKSSASQSPSSPAASPSTPSTTATSTTSTTSNTSTTSTTSNSEGSATHSDVATGDNVATTVITITSCADHICTKRPVTTGVTVCTATENGVETIYTTYCPLSGVTQEAATPETPAPVTTPAATTPATSPATTLASVSQSQAYTPPAVATATGMAAAVEVKGAAFVAALAAFAAIM